MQIFQRKRRPDYAQSSKTIRWPTFGVCGMLTWTFDQTLPRRRWRLASTRFGDLIDPFSLGVPIIGHLILKLRRDPH